MATVWDGLKRWARAMKGHILILWIAARDSRTPLSAKILAAAVAAYALSPIDLIPDFIPLLGYVDDLLILPIGIMLAIRLIPDPLLEEFRATAANLSKRPRSTTAAAAIILIWLIVLGCFGYWLASMVG